MVVAARGVRGPADLAALCPLTLEASDEVSTRTFLQKLDGLQPHSRAPGVLFGLLLVACASVASAVNQPPSVYAGPLQNVFEGQTVRLHAVASDPDGDPLTYVWTQEEGPIVTLNGQETADASFIAPTVATVAEASLTFQVTVSDGRGGTAYDIANVWVYLAGDANRNDRADVSDLLMLAAAWGSRRGDAKYDARCNFNNDASVDVSDLLVLGAAWGSRRGDANYNELCDLNNDDSVDAADVPVLADAWGTLSGDANYDSLCDFNDDGSVDGADLLTLAISWGRWLQ